MNKLVMVCVVLLGATVARASRPDAERWPVREQENTERTLTLAGSPKRLVVDNVFGYVHLNGVSGSQVKMTIHKTIRAETPADFEQAKREIRLEAEETPGSVSVYYDAPWRCRQHEVRCERNQQQVFYTVTYDLDVEAPPDARIVLSTTNEGDVRVDRFGGNFEVSNVNGGIAMTNVAGAGRVNTVNGPVTVRFARNPGSPVSFQSVNGELNIWFQPGLAADLLLKTFNGESYSDFEVKPRPAPQPLGERRDGKFVYQSRGFQAARIGQGGPELSFDTLNGNIRLHEAGNER